MKKEADKVETRVYYREAKDLEEKLSEQIQVEEDNRILKELKEITNSNGTTNISTGGISGTGPYIGDPIDEGYTYTPNTNPWPNQGYTIRPNTASNNSIWINPSPYGYGTGSSSSSITVGSNDKYAVFRLPEKTIPNKVYVSGRLITVGILGSDVQAAYAGGNKLIFAPHELGVVEYNNRLTVSLDYGDYVYHYNVQKNDYGKIQYEDESTVVKAKLVSKVKQR